MGGTSRFRGYNQGGQGQAGHLQPQGDAGLGQEGLTVLGLADQELGLLS